MEILILGGTGAMGVPLVKLLSKDNKLFVTSRSKKENKENITYIQGNAKDPEFFSSLNFSPFQHFNFIFVLLLYHCRSVQNS